MINGQERLNSAHNFCNMNEQTIYPIKIMITLHTAFT